jgi:glutathionylspermidine synthase
MAGWTWPYDGRTIKLLEYNADTPTALVEAAVAQWYWLKEVFPKADQFNSLHEKLVAKWKELEPYVAKPVYFGHDGERRRLDDRRLSARHGAAGGAEERSRCMTLAGDRLQAKRSRFVDLELQPIESIFKLYPWEWLLNDKFGDHALRTLRKAEAMDGKVVDGADLEDAVVEQGAAGDPVGAESESRAAAAGVSGWSAGDAEVCQQAFLWARGRRCLRLWEWTG